MVSIVINNIVQYTSLKPNVSFVYASTIRSRALTSACAYSQSNLKSMA